jgi:hypothetical protein
MAFRLIILWLGRKVFLSESSSSLFHLIEVSTAFFHRIAESSVVKLVIAVFEFPFKFASVLTRQHLLLLFTSRFQKSVALVLVADLLKLVGVNLYLVG